MKKLTPVLLAAILVILTAATSFSAVGTCTQSLETIRMDTQGDPFQKVLTFTCTAGTAGEAGAYPATAVSTAYTNNLKGWYLYKIMTNPGSVNPDAWGFTFLDGEGIDVLGGNGASRHATNSQMFAPLLTTGVYYAQPVLDAWTLTITGNSTASAVVVVKFIYVR
jgi:hypothetical protein